MKREFSYKPGILLTLFHTVFVLGLFYLVGQIGTTAGFDLYLFLFMLDFLIALPFLVLMYIDIAPVGFSMAFTISFLVLGGLQWYFIGHFLSNNRIRERISRRFSRKGLYGFAVHTAFLSFVHLLYILHSLGYSEGRAFWQYVLFALDFPAALSLHFFNYLPSALDHTMGTVFGMMHFFVIGGIQWYLIGLLIEKFLPKPKVA